MTKITEEISQEKELTKEIAYLFPRQGEWTESDYFRLPQTNKIVELSKGRIIITPSPTEQHQMILGNLYSILRNYIKINKLGKILMAPMDVRLWEGNIRQPDIIFMSNEHLNRTTTELWNVPDLAIEILSENTIKEDREEKYKEYQKAGILEYWIVDPFNQSIEIYTLENSVYKLFGKWRQGEIAKSRLLDGFEVSVDEIMV